MKIKLLITYDGTDFCGWQVQDGKRTVQGEIENAIESITGERVRVTGSGRTDSGVHAEGQVAHFVTEKEGFPPEKFAPAINARLPEDVKILKSERVDDEFDACRTAKRKTYRYSLYLSEVEKPLSNRYATQIYKKPCLESMREGAKVLIGEHDFKVFNASGSGAKTTVRTIYDINIEEHGDRIDVWVTGNGFLYNMVRTLVGTLLEVGYGDKTEKDLIKMLESGDRARCGRTLSARGLCLINVEY